MTLVRRLLLGGATIAALLTMTFCAAYAFLIYDSDQQERRAQAAAAANPLFHRPLVSTAGQIAVAARKESSTDLYLVRADGSGLTNLTGASAARGSVGGFNYVRSRGPVGWFNYGLDWSPDGHRVAFVTNGAAAVITSTGVGLVLLPGRGLGGWLPGGAKLVLPLREGGLAVAAADGSSVAPIPNSASANFGRPYVSPAGRHVLFVQMARYSRSDYRYDFFVVGLDGTDVTQVRPPPGDCGPNVAWAPDGTRLAIDCGDAVYVLDPGGPLKSRVTVDDRIERNGPPAWSPDGRRLALSRRFNGQWGIVVLDLMTGAVERLTDGRGGGHWPAWSPDGSRIAFVRDEDLVVMNADGSGLTVLTRLRDQGIHVAGAPVWQPDRP